jgi:ceramide glucosyltransferase
MTLLGAYAAFLLLLQAACVAASVARFRRPRACPAASRGFTLIKPVKGLDDLFEDNLESIAASDPGKALQTIVALESAEDPAHAAAKRFQARHPDRDIVVLLTGPSGGRMGKIHNMISALKAAKHDRVVFSDADVPATPGLVRETSLAFDEGCGAVFGLPVHARAGGAGGWLFMTAFNHFFCVPAALNYYAGRYRFCAGAWMAFTKEALAEAGGSSVWSA